jgi:hypothetical protein
MNISCRYRDSWFYDDQSTSVKKIRINTILVGFVTSIKYNRINSIIPNGLTVFSSGRRVAQPLWVMSPKCFYLHLTAKPIWWLEHHLTKILSVYFISLVGIYQQIQYHLNAIISTSIRLYLMFDCLAYEFPHPMAYARPYAV